MNTENAQELIDLHWEELGEKKTHFLSMGNEYLKDRNTKRGETVESRAKEMSIKERI